jgi:hypothetical protein
MRRSPLLVLALALAACSGESDEAVTVVESGESERIRALARQVQELEAQVRASKVTEREAQEIRNRLGDLERRLRTFEESETGAVGSPADVPDETPGTDEPERRDPALPVPSGDNPVFDETQIQSFRLLQEEVERRKDLERRTQRVKQQLDRLKIGLSPSVEQAVIDRTLAHQTEVQALFRGGFGRSEEERTENTAKLETLRSGYEADLRRMVSDEHADKVVEALGRAFPGFVRRSVDRGSVRPRDR